VEHRNLLGAGRGEVLPHQGAVGLVEIAAPGRHDLLDVAGGLRDRIDAVDGQALERAVHDERDMGGRIGRRQVHPVPPLHEAHGDGCRRGRLADPALAHDHDQTASGLRQFIDHRGKTGRVRRGRNGDGSGCGKASSRNRRRRAGRPTMSNDRSGTSVRGSADSSGGRSAITAAWSRARPSATASPGFAAHGTRRSRQAAGCRAPARAVRPRSAPPRAPRRDPPASPARSTSARDRRASRAPHGTAPPASSGPNADRGRTRPCRCP
jgi:hypothetical protein